MRYITKPITIEAKQWHTPDTLPELGVKDELGVYLVQHTVTVGGKGHGEMHHPQTPTFVIDTRQRTVSVFDGDFIIKLDDGETYPCNPEVFNNKYEQLG